MNKDKLIVRLTRELYDLKNKLEEVREHAQFIYTADEIGSRVHSAAIDILNLIESEEVYD
jgi:hypothetical protein